MASASGVSSTAVDQASKDVDVKPTLPYDRPTKTSRGLPIAANPDNGQMSRASLASLKFKRRAPHTANKAGGDTSSLAPSDGPAIKKEKESEDEGERKYHGMVKKEPDQEYCTRFASKKPTKTTGSQPVETEIAGNKTVTPACNRVEGTDFSQSTRGKRPFAGSLVPPTTVGQPVIESTSIATVEENSSPPKIFTPFFDKKMRTLRSPLPLTIFNPEWQKAALAYEEDRKRRGEEESSDDESEEDMFYTGYAYPDEIRQNFLSWTMNHRCFHATLRDVYKFKTFAAWMLVHKANADKIMERDGFMAALRYDIHVRANAFAYRVRHPDGTESVSDVSVLRQDIREHTFSKARNFNELDCKDNPYLPGGDRHGYNPITGQREQQLEEDVAWDQDSSSSYNNHDRPPPKRAHSYDRVTRNPRYRGRFYNPNFSAHRNRGHNSRKPSGSRSNV